MVKMIVFDLDGSLLNGERKISLNSKNYLKKLKDMGYIITIATGRMYESAKYAMDEFNYVNYIITDNGVACYDAKNGDIIFDNPIQLEKALKIKKYHNDDCRFIEFSDKDTIYSYTDMNKDEYFIKTTKDWDYIFDNCKGISHITLSMKTNEQLMEVYDKLKKEFYEDEVNIMQDSFSDRKWIEILNGGCFKCSAIKKLSDKLNINNDDIIVFGDGLNDIDMLKNCGIGVALNNALQVVKENADYVTKLDNKDDGVIDFLRSYLGVK